MVSRTFADPDTLEWATTAAAATTPAVRRTVTEALASVEALLLTTDARLDTAAVRAAADEAAATLESLPERLDELDRGVQHFASAMRWIDARSLSGIHGVLGVVLDAVFAQAGEEGGWDRFAILTDASARLPDASPDEVAAFFEDLERAEAAELARSRPRLVGSLDGAPGWVRDLANRERLGGEISHLEAQLDDLDAQLRSAIGPAGQGRRHVLREQRSAVLDQLDTLEQLRDREGEVQLLLLEPREGRLVAAVGDVDTADHVSVMVPGTGNRVGTFMDQVTTGERLGRLAEDVAPGESVATVTWLGYDAPPSLLQARDPGRAVEAAPDLAAFTSGLAAANPDSHRSLLGHSYGSTTVGATARKHDLDVDVLVGFGSPGMRAAAADEFRLADGGRTYAVTDSTGGRWGAGLPFVGGDIIHSASDSFLTSSLGGDPTVEDFGADSFDVSSAGGHASSRYLDPDSASGHNFALVITGRHDEVTR
jgi:hypothetical protein